MKNLYTFLAITIIGCSNVSYAQIVPPNVFLQGQWTEVGELPNGAFGTYTMPPGYHSPVGGLDITYDWGHDGWGVGTPAFMGPYGLPGFPQEGWAMEINGVQTQAYLGGSPSCGGGCAGSITAYTKSPGNATSTWSGVNNGLTMTQWTSVDTEASWVVITTLFKNLTAAPIPAVYYMRTLDPDNAVYWGGSFTTVNTIVHQNDIDHRVQVSAYDASFGAVKSYLALGTKDCRAKAFIVDFGLVPTSNLVDIYNQSGGASGYKYTGTYTNDVGIGLVWNLGTIKNGDSTIISYAYIMDNDNGIDSALPDPVLSINNAVITTYPDTFDACAFPTLDSVQLSIIYGDSKDWSWGKWTWSPGTALSATTGVNVWADITAIPSYITYTVTGVDSNANMYSCNMKQFVFTLKSCHSAWNNSPCYGDELMLGMRGDSTGATYFWKGPGGFTSTLHDPIINPAVFADSGLYYVYKTIAGVVDTDSTYVIIHPKPIMGVTSNGPLCSGLVDTLNLGIAPVTPGETFSWTGPNSFTSTMSNPSIPGFLSINAGIYTVVAINAFGCKDTGTVNVGIVPPPPPPIINGTPVYCYGAPFDTFTVTGANVLWYYPDSTFPGVVKKPTIHTDSPGTYTVYATQTFGCISPKASYTVTVKPQIIPLFSWKATLGCNSDQVTFTNLSNADWYLWEFGDGSVSTDTFTTSHTYKPSTQSQSVKLHAYIPGCEQDTVAKVDLVHSVKALFSPIPDTMCAGQMTIKNDSFTIFQNNSYAIEPNGPGGTPNLAGLAGIAGGPDNGIDTVKNLVNYSWNFGDGTTDNLQSPHSHIYNTGGRYHVTLSVTDSIGCVDTTSRDVIVLQYAIQITHDTMLCISQPLPLLNAVTAVPRIVDGTVGLIGSKDYHQDDFNYHWTPADHLDDTSARVPYYTGQGLTTYTYTATEKQFGCYAVDTERIHSVIGVVLQNVTTTTTIPYGNSIQLNADSEVIYMWKPDDGSLSNPNINNPVAKPLVTTLYTVYGYDHNGCLDSAYVNVVVDSTMTEDIPTGFTPNGDGLNDVFRPVGLKFQNMLEFRIYNRWGKQLFYSNNPKVGWDGTFDGVPQDLGVYYYVIIVGKPGGDGLNLTYKGEVTLIR